MSYGNRYFHQGEQADTEYHARLYPLLRAGEENQGRGRAAVWSNVIETEGYRL